MTVKQAAEAYWERNEDQIDEDGLVTYSDAYYAQCIERATARAWIIAAYRAGWLAKARSSK